MVRTPRANPPRVALEDAEKKARAARRWFFVSLAVVVVSRIPYYLNFYPAFITFDTVDQYTEVFNGAFTNLHPILHTLSIGLALRLGPWLGLSEAASLSGYAVAQALAQAAACAWLVSFLRCRGRTLWAPALALAYLALHPLHALYAITLWKDIPFGLAVTALALLLYRVAETEGACLGGRGFFAALLATLIGVSFLRNNGIIVTVAAAVALIVWRPARKNRAALLAVVAVGAVTLIQWPLFGLLQLQRTPVTELLSLPMQQIGFVVRDLYPLTPEEEEDIDYLIPLDVLAEAYNPITADDIKQHEDFYGDYLCEHLDEYVPVWYEIGKRYPAAYIEAHGLLTLRYWYPLAAPQARFYPNPKPPDALLKHYPTEPLTDAFLWLNDLSPRDFIATRPWSTLLFNQPPLFWALMAACACLWARREARYWLALIPLLAVWIPMLWAPLAEARYICALYFCLPLTLWMTAGKRGSGARA